MIVGNVLSNWFFKLIHSFKPEEPPVLEALLCPVESTKREGIQAGDIKGSGELMQNSIWKFLRCFYV